MRENPYGASAVVTSDFFVSIDSTATSYKVLGIISSLKHLIAFSEEEFHVLPAIVPFKRLHPS